MSNELKLIQKILRGKSNSANISWVSRIVPGNQKIYGVKTPELNLIVGQFKEGSFGLAEELWKSGALEERIIAIKILEKTGRRDPEKLLRLFKKFASNIDNWAVCDGLGMQCLRGAVKTRSADIFLLAKKFNSSADPWQRRLSLVMIEWYTRHKAFHPKIKSLIRNLSSDDEYYVRKAVEWLKGNLAKGK